MEVETQALADAAATTGAPPRKRRKFSGLYANPHDTRFKDGIDLHPKAIEIDRDIMAKELSISEIAAKWGLAGAWTVNRRRKKLVRLAKQRLERQARDLSTPRVNKHRAEKRALALMEEPLKKAMAGFDRLMAVAETPADIERGATYLDKYLEQVRLFGELTGELGGPVVQHNSQYNVHQNLLNVMALPRSSDTPEQLARAAQLGLPQPVGQVIEAKAEPGPDEDEDDYDDPDDPGYPDDDDEDANS